MKPQKRHLRLSEGQPAVPVVTLFGNLGSASPWYGLVKHCGLDFHAKAVIPSFIKVPGQHSWPLVETQYVEIMDIYGICLSTYFNYGDMLILFLDKAWVIVVT